jgi:hypothetical protein
VKHFPMASKHVYEPSLNIVKHYKRLPMRLSVLVCARPTTN